MDKLLHLIEDHADIILDHQSKPLDYKKLYSLLLCRLSKIISDSPIYLYTTIAEPKEILGLKTKLTELLAHKDELFGIDTEVRKIKIK